MPRALATVSFLSFTGSSSVMIHLIYGIIRDQGASGPPFPVGPDGSPVAVVATEGIAAASAAVRQCPSSSELASVLAFAHVVSALHSQCAVLPMRFGSCVNSLPELTEMLTLRAATFRTALDVIEGCEEMGLRAVWNAAGDRAKRAAPYCREPRRGRGAAQSPSLTRHTGIRPSTSLAFALATTCAGPMTRLENGAVEALKSAFAGLFVAYEADSNLSGDETSISLHFLTRRRDRERFVSTFHQFRDRSDVRLLLTGPWPPYHFSAALSTLDRRVLAN